MYQEAQTTSGERNFYQVTLSEAKLDEAKPDGVTANPIEAGMLWVSLAFILGWTVIFFKVLERLTVVPEKLLSPLKPVNKISCKTCQFYSNNRYLPCAVNPSMALMEQAVNCPDYCCQDGKYSSLRIHPNKHS